MQNKYVNGNISNKKHKKISYVLFHQWTTDLVYYVQVSLLNISNKLT